MTRKKASHSLWGAVLGVCGIIAATFLSVVISCSQKSFHIAYVATLSGENSDLGLAARNGVLLASEEINARGGINGVRIKIDYADDKYDPTLINKLDRAFIAKGYPLIIGHVTSRMAKAGIAALENSDTLLVSPSATSSEFSGIDDSFIRVCPPNSLQAYKLSEYSRLMGFSSIAIIYDKTNSVYSLDYAKEFEKAFKGRGIRITNIPFDSKTINYDFAAFKAASLKSDAVLIIASAYDTAHITQNLRRNGVRHILSSGWGMTDDLIKYGGKSVEEVVSAHYFVSSNSNDALGVLEQKYEKRFHEKMIFASLFGYDAMNMVAEAIGTKDPLSMTGADIKNAIIARKKYSSPQGDFYIDRFGDSERRAKLYRVRGGRFVLMEE